MYRASIVAAHHGPPLPERSPPMLPPPPNTTHLQQAVLRGLEEYRGGGSIIAYDSKRAEYREFCESLHANPSEYMYIVNGDKMFYFMFYTAMREQRSRGGNKKRNSAGAAPKLFDRADYDAVLARYAVWWEGVDDPTQELPHPKNPVGIQAMVQYKAAVKAEYDHQITMEGNSLPWDLIWTERSKKYSTT